MPTATEYPTVGAMWNDLLLGVRPDLATRWQQRDHHVIEAELRWAEAVAVSSAEVLAALQGMGVTLPAGTLRYWAAEGIVPRPRRGQRAEGRGTYADWPADTVAAAYVAYHLMRGPMRMPRRLLALARQRATAVYPSRVPLDGLSLWEAGLRLRPWVPADDPLRWVVDATWEPAGAGGWDPRRRLSDEAQAVVIWRASYDVALNGWPPDEPVQVRFVRVGPERYVLRALRPTPS